MLFEIVSEEKIIFVSHFHFFGGGFLKQYHRYVEP